jgi:Family of unknown function (DUF6607)
MGVRVSAAVILLAATLGAPSAWCAPRQFTFSWPYSSDDAMRPRGGTTKGAPLALATKPSDAWRAVHEPGLTKFERDRRAILAMAGGYRTTFDFIETVGFTDGYEPPRPYQSWGTEYIYVVEDSGTTIRLQHVMVMFVADRSGKIQGPFVQKHWRQDWRYEDTDLHVFVGHDRWERQRRSPEDVRGRWSQAVFQVDDSPRYEALGEWVHEGNYSSWTSETTARPLPRRESSVRKDYQVLEGVNRHTLTPTGWVQEEDNLKLVLGADGKPDPKVPYLAREVGVARYEHVADFDFSAGDHYWERSGRFWADVRAAWAKVYAERDSFEYLESVDGEAMFMPLFDYAGKLDDGEDYDPAEAAAVIERAFSKHLR